jgi:OOP family OmpA-OmpF porin
MHFLQRPTARTGAGFAMAVVLTAVSATACGPEDTARAKPPSCPEIAVPGVAIAFGGRANSAAPVVPTAWDTALDTVMDAEEGFTIVRVDGQPTVVCGQRFKSRARSTEAKKKEKRVFKQFAHAVLGHVRAVEPEADPLRALSYAATAAQPGGTVLLVDSGLQTVAPLDFRKPGLLNDDPDALVRDLRRRNLLPDLKDRKVVLAGIGYAAEPQIRLDEATRKRLVALWEKIARAGGATDVTVVPNPNTRAAIVDEPKVSLVPIAALDSIQLRCDTKSILSEDEIGFVPDTADIKDPAKARDLLGTFADWLADVPQAKVMLVGTVAHYGVDNGNTGLSRRRAERVAELLVELGVAGDRITARGAGWGPFPKKEAPPGPEHDQQNRRVVLSIDCD